MDQLEIIIENVSVLEVKHLHTIRRVYLEKVKLLEENVVLPRIQNPKVGSFEVGQIFEINLKLIYV